MRCLDLFSGIGGFALGFQRAGIETVAFCEIDSFCREVLKKNFSGVPILEDIKALDGKQFQGIDIVCGGFPCQDISVAGKGAGIENGTKSGLWREMHRVIREAKPSWVVVENVANIKTKGADRVISDLEGIGYACWSFVVGAWAVGHPQKRERAWIIALSNADLGRFDAAEISDESRKGDAVSSGGCVVGNTENSRRDNTSTEAQRAERQNRRSSVSGRGEEQQDWEMPRIFELEMGGSINGISAGVVRFANSNALKAYGNSVVPQITECIGRMIKEAIWKIN